MKFLRNYSLIFALFLSVLLIGTSCNTGDGTGKLRVRLTDAPADYVAVNVEILEVEYQVAGLSWETLDGFTPGIYNLLDYTNGATELLGTSTLPEGMLAQVRLILGTNNSIEFEDGTIAALTTPSGQQTGVKLNIGAQITEGVTYELLLDFDAAQSVVKAGASGMYLLKPVIRVVTEFTSGAIAGTISPANESTVIFAVSGSDTVGSAFSDTTSGGFLVQALAAGSYTVRFNTESGNSVPEKTGINVTNGQVTDIGIVVVQ